MSRPTPSVINANGEVNFKALEATIALAVEQDARYQRENDAKFRAVAQKVQTYEEFEGIVKASHIRPITEDITNLSLGRSGWNAGGRPQGVGDAAPAGSSSIPPLPALSTSTAPSSSKPLPKDDRQFAREWRACVDAKSKCDLLYRVGAAGLAAVFPVEIGHGLLGEFFKAMLESLSEESVTSAVEILRAISKCPRFRLMLDFLGDEDTKALSSLLSSPLMASADDLKKLYAI